MRLVRQSVSLVISTEHLGLWSSRSSPPVETGEGLPEFLIHSTSVGSAITGLIWKRFVGCMPANLNVVENSTSVTLTSPCRSSQASVTDLGVSIARLLAKARRYLSRLGSV